MLVIKFLLCLIQGQGNMILMIKYRKNQEERYSFPYRRDLNQDTSKIHLKKGFPIKIFNFLNRRKRMSLLEI